MEKVNKKHILVISQYFFPEQFRINDICLEMVKKGYKVTVLTGIPNYPEGKFFKGYGYTKKRKENWNGIDIIRIPLTPRGHSKLGMIFNYISFIISGWFWKIFTNIKPNLIFTFEVSPMTQALIGCWLSKKRKIPHYLYVQDLWPENVQTVTGINSKIIINPINKMVDYIYKKTSKIFVTSPSFIDSICNRKEKVSRDKVYYLPQYAEDFYKPTEERSPLINNDDKFKIIFTGNIGTAQGLDVLPKTAKLLVDTNVLFVIVGNGRYLNELKKEIDRNNLQDMFLMIDRQKPDDVPSLLNSCDVAFLSFKNDPLWDKTIPAKLQSYMACGMPVLASASGETKRIIEESQCGYCSKIGNPLELKESILRIKSQNLNDFKTNSRKYYLDNFDKEIILNKMFNAFEE